MEETRDYSGVLGVERSRRAGNRRATPRAVAGFAVGFNSSVLLLNAVALSMTVQAFQPRPQPCSRCPFDWIGYRRKCYYFSEAEGNWASSQDNCSALGASLAMLDGVEDLSFVMRYKGISEHWIGLSRENEEQPWSWLNRSRLSHPFQVRGSGLCAYLNTDGLSSSRCSSQRSWVCNKAEQQ
ncbi:CLC2E protein, partial [Bucorvus abyssinicus]|nr:CLC2E protein [Bucorvus abyssinicus]